MISVLLAFTRLLGALWRGIKKDMEFRVLVYMLGTLLSGATFFYWRVEGTVNLKANRSD